MQPPIPSELEGWLKIAISDSSSRQKTNKPRKLDRGRDTAARTESCRSDCLKEGEHYQTVRTIGTARRRCIC